MIKITISNLLLSLLALSIIIASDATPITQSNQHGHNKIGKSDSRREAELEPLKAAASVELYRLGEEPNSATLERPQESTTSSWTSKLSKSEGSADSKHIEKTEINEALDSASSQEYVVSEEPDNKAQQEMVYVSPPYENSPQSLREMPQLTYERPQEAYPATRNNQTSEIYSYSPQEISEQATRGASHDGDSNHYHPSSYHRSEPEDNNSNTYTPHQHETSGLSESTDGVVSEGPQQNDGPSVYRSHESQPQTAPEQGEIDHEAQQRQLDEVTRNLNQVPSIDTLKLVAEATGWPATILTEVPLKDMPLHVLEKLKRDYGVKVIATRDGPDQPLNIICEELTNSDTYPCDAAKKQRLAAHIQESIVASRHNNLSFLGIPSRQDQKEREPQSHVAEPSRDGNAESYPNVESQSNPLSNQTPVTYVEQ